MMNASRRYILIQIAMLGSVALIALALGAHAHGVRSPIRQALWQVVRTCMANHALTGAAFPCLKVNLSDGQERGYVVLRPPFGPPDTILTPTRKIAGIEDPWLQTNEATNYFEAAWNSRALIKTDDGLPPPDDNVVLAVNSNVLRSQDQLHIHMGCLIPSAKSRLRSAAATLGGDHWTRLENFIPGADMWAYPTGRSSLSGIEPFRLAADEFAASASDRAKLALAVTMLHGAAGDQFVILASRIDVDQKWPILSAERIMQESCSNRYNTSEANFRSSSQTEHN